LHDLKLHRSPALSNAAGNFLHCLDNVRMVGLAGIAPALREIVWPDAVQIDARYRDEDAACRRAFWATGSGTSRISAERLPHPVKVGHPGRANKAVPAGWIRRIVDARFAMQ